MNYNHPYFATRKITPSSTYGTTGVNPNDEDYFNIFAEDHNEIKPYEPKTVDITNPSWVEAKEPLPLSPVEFVEYTENDGCFVGACGRVMQSLRHKDNPVMGNVIHSMRVIPMDDNWKHVGIVKAQIVNTQNAGFRYVAKNEEGGLDDVGPVEDTCIIGNYKRPEALFVPLSNLRAVADAVHFLEGYMDVSEEEYRNNPGITGSF